MHSERTRVSCVSLLSSWRSLDKLGMTVQESVRMCQMSLHRRLSVAPQPPSPTRGFVASRYVAVRLPTATGAAAPTGAGLPSVARQLSSTSVAM